MKTPPLVEGDGRERELVPKSAARLGPDAARKLALKPVAAAVVKTCTWGVPGADWEVGDYRFLVLDFTPNRSTGLYLQIWSEPGEPVLIEACSGAWNPAARPYIGPRQRAALRAMGFRVGGRARNYQKHWTLSPLADARALAGDLVAVLVDIFGYRGHRPITMQLCTGSRTEPARVFPSVEPDDVRQMLRIGGCRVVHAAPVGPVKPGVLKRLIQVDQPFPFTVELKGESGTRRGTFEAMRFITVLAGGRGVSDAGLAVLQRDCPFARLFRDADGDVMMIYDVPVAGASARWFLLVLLTWEFAWRTANRLALELGTMRADADGEGVDSADEDAADAGESGDGDEDDARRQRRTARTVVH